MIFALPGASGSTPGALGVMPGALPELPSQATAAAAPSDSMLSWVLQTMAGQPQASIASGERVLVGAASAVRSETGSTLT